MGQQSIAEILTAKYPKWMTAKDIIDLGKNARAVYKALESLRKRDEVELKILYRDAAKVGRPWKIYYRIKRRETNGTEQ